MRSVRLVCDRVENNNHKYYYLDLVQDLLQNWCVIRRWGRIGVSECFETRGFSTREKAEAEFCRLESRERKQGYVDFPAENSPAFFNAAPMLDDGIVGLIPKHRHRVLDHKLEAVFARTRQVAAFLRVLRGHGIVYVGHLVQAPPPLLRKLAKGDGRLMAYVERRLAELDLQLGSRAPGWHNVVALDEKDWLPLWSEPQSLRPFQWQKTESFKASVRRLAFV